MANRDNLSTEEWVNKYWEQIDIPSLRTALQVTHKRHTDDKVAAADLKGMYPNWKTDPYVLAFINMSDAQQAWRRKVEARIQALEQQKEDP